MKPYDMNLLPKRILQVYQIQKETKTKFQDTRTAMNSQPRAIRAKERQSYTLRDYAEADVIKALRDIGVPAHLSGYGYLQKAILETVLSERGFIPITKELYPMIAESFNTTGER